MGRRGRRPHPDILTPREWEVLDLLRERLTNEQIAERLGITLDGAKYHVSEILSKLSVETRQEAVEWQPTTTRPWWERLISLPLAARIAGGATLIAAGAGITLLVWGSITTRGPRESESPAAGSNLPLPVGEARLSSDAALIAAAQYIGLEAKDAEIEVILTTYRAARDAIQFGGSGPQDPPDEAATWLVRFRGMFSQPVRFWGVDPLTTPGSPTPSCQEISVFFADSNPFYASSGGSFSGACPPGDSVALNSREAALLAASYGPDAPWRGVLPPQETHVEMSDYGQALDYLSAEGWSPPSGRDGTMDPVDRVWLVTLKGAFFPPPDQTPPSPPGLAPSD